MYYDLHVQTDLSIGENSVAEMAEMGRKLGLNGIGVVRYYGAFQPITQEEGIDIADVIMIKAADADDLNESVRKARGMAEVIMVHGGDYDINRAACENSMVDILCHPELNRSDSGLDHVCARAAHDNNVAVEINFREVAESHRRNRVRVLSFVRRNIKLCREYDVPVIASSGAVSKWGMRAPREIASIAHVLGLELERAIRAVSEIPENILNINKEKLAGRRREGLRIAEE